MVGFPCLNFVFKQKAGYGMRISDLSSDVCSSDLSPSGGPLLGHGGIESGAVDAEGLRPQGVFGQIIGETISVIEPESGFARQHVPFLHSCRCLIKQAKTFFECLTKTRYRKNTRLNSSH